MPERKEIRRKARISLKKHYWIFVAACLFAAILGTQYANTMQLFRLQKNRRTEERGSVTTALGASGREGEVSLYNDVINGNWQGIVDSLTHRVEVYQGEDTYIGDVEMGHSRGILASVVNQLASGSLLLSILTVFDTILGKTSLAVILLALLGFLLYALFWIFVSNVYRTVNCRIFLEGRIYEKIPFSRFVFLLKVKKHAKAAWAMAAYTLMLYVWLFTIVLFPVKRYAYLMAPYLVAENPDLSPKEAIRLSSRMMKGHKWEAFLLEMTLLPWTVLSIASGGLIGILFSNPYKEAVFAEYCADIRRRAVAEKIEGYELLNDKYLYITPTKGELDAAYQDILRLRKIPPLEPRKGFWGFLEKYFGVVLNYDSREKEYRSRMQTEQLVEEYQDALDGKTYPTRLFPIPEKEKRRGDSGYMRHYSIPSVILLFFAGSLFGWLWEVALHLMQTGEFVNRGVLHGPWLPIYGGGLALVLVLLYTFRKKPLVEFLMIIVVCGIVEYATSVILELMHDGQSWWNYNGYYLNLNGRICAEGLLVFGIGGAAVVYVVAPFLDNLVEKIKAKILWPICIALLLVFCVDAVYSTFAPNTGKGISGGGKTQETGV